MIVRSLLLYFQRNMAVWLAITAQQFRLRRQCTVNKILPRQLTRCHPCQRILTRKVEDILKNTANPSLIPANSESLCLRLQVN